MAGSLHKAVEKSDLKKAETVLSKKTDINAKDFSGNTALYLAVEKGNLPMTKLLLSKGADVNIQYEGNYTVLMIALYNRKKNENDNKELIAEILKYKPNLEVKNKNGENALFVSLYQNSESMNMLLEAGANPEAVDSRGNTALVNAVEHGNGKAILALLQHGADKSVVKDADGSIMYSAGMSDNLELMSYLLKNGYDVNTKSEKGFTALHASKTVEMSALLLKNKANVNITNNNGQTPIFGVIGYDMIDEEYRLPHLKLLIKNGAEVNIQSKDGLTPLHIASLNNSYGMIPVLIQAGAKLETKDSEGYTAIMLAAYEGNIEAIQALVKAGANTKAQNNEGETALQIAESRQHKAIVEFLKAH